MKEMPSKKKSSLVDEPVKEPEKKKFAGKLLGKLGLLFVLLLAVAVGIYYFLQYQKTQQVLKNPSLAAQMEQASLVDKVGKLIDLPKDEQPTIATVSDISKLKGQSFFEKAQNGFKVLIYAKAKKAILYDPQNNKLVEVGPINLGQPSANASPNPSVPTTPLKVAIYNGTKTVGLASNTEKKLQESMKNLTVVEKANAKGEYTKTIVIDLTGKQQAVASQLAKLLAGETGSLPKTETKAASTEADILVILGK